MVTCEFGGGLGNRIFQYVSARLLAEILGYSFESGCPLDNVLTPTIPATGKKYTQNKIHIIENNDNSNVFIAKWQKQHIHLQGYFQVADYYIPYRDKIIGFFNEQATKTPDNENIVIHIRLNDYKIFGEKGNVLNPKYYLDCLKRESFNRLFIVTDSPNDSYLDNFKSFNPIVSRGNLINDFWLITEFSRMIIANSTFSWWAAFLSNANKIYTPKCWVRDSNDIPHNLHMIDNGGCECIPVDTEHIDYDRKK